MEKKKSPKADLENKRNTLFLLALVISLGAILFAFEWNTAPSTTHSLGEIAMAEVEEEFIPPTRAEEIKPPPPSPPKAIEIIIIVDNETELDEELVIEDSEADDETLIDVQPIIETVDEEEDLTSQIFQIVEDKPEFPGGNAALMAFLSNSVKYPVIAQENGIQGRVFLKFVVNEDGSVSGAEILRGVDPSIDKEALKAVGMLPKFEPGKQRGRPVKVYFQATINFVLQ